MVFLKDLGCRICQLSGESKATPYLFRHLSSLHVRSCAARELGNGHFEFLLLCYVLNPPPPIKFCSLSLSLISSSSISSNINFIHIHTWSLYIRSLAFECCNIALVIFMHRKCLHVRPSLHTSGAASAVDPRVWLALARDLDPT